MQVLLRDVVASDLPVFFEQQRDPAANHMAAFSPRDPNDREAFTAHWAKLLADETVIIKTVVFQGQVAGSVGSFEWHGKPQVTYWIGREYWGRGVATQALSEFLRQFRRRPVYASAAADNLASLRVLQKCGFVVTGSEKAFAKARGSD